MSLFASKVLLFFKSSVKSLQNFKPFLLETPETSLALAYPSSHPLGENYLQDDIGDKESGFLWAAPKKRVSLERRLTRKAAHCQKWVPKTNIITCYVCGHFHQMHTVCGNCYDRIKKETNEMQEAIQAKLKFDPVDKEVVVLYEKEPKPKLDRNEILVEVPKERPQWFSKNLLSKGNENALARRPKDLNVLDVDQKIK